MVYDALASFIDKTVVPRHFYETCKTVVFWTDVLGALRAAITGQPHWILLALKSTAEIFLPKTLDLDQQRRDTATMRQLAGHRQINACLTPKENHYITIKKCLLSIWDSLGEKWFHFISDTESRKFYKIPNDIGNLRNPRDLSSFRYLNVITHRDIDSELDSSENLCSQCAQQLF